MGVNTKKRCAFTLVEIMIAIGIIGIVAAITVPTMIQNSNSKKFATYNGAKVIPSSISSSFPIGNLCVFGNQADINFGVGRCFYHNGSGASGAFRSRSNSHIKIFCVAD